MLFSRSGVPLPELGRIWILSDLNQDQRLDKQEFAIAMFLIHCRLKGREIPTPLPDVLIASARDDYIPSSPVIPSISKDDKGRYNIDLDSVVGGSSISQGGTPGFPPSVPSAISSAPGESTASAPPSLGSTRQYSSTTNLMVHSNPSSAQPSPATPQYLGVPNPMTPSQLSLSPAVGASVPSGAHISHPTLSPATYPVSVVQTAVSISTFL